MNKWHNKINIRIGLIVVLCVIVDWLNIKFSLFTDHLVISRLMNGSTLFLFLSYIVMLLLIFIFTPRGR